MNTEKYFYIVLEDGKLCDYRNHRVHESWDCAVYPTFDEAKKYAQKWLGTFGGLIESAVEPFKMADSLINFEVRKVSEKELQDLFPNMECET